MKHIWWIGPTLILLSSSLFGQNEESSDLIQKLPGVVRYSVPECNFHERVEGGVTFDTFFNHAWDADDTASAVAKIHDVIAVLKLVESSGDRFRSACKPGETFREVWRADHITVILELVTDSPGAEACWFKGTMKIVKRPPYSSSSQPTRTQTMEVGVGCGI